MAVSVEAGPLLLASEKATGYADTEANGAVYGQAVWKVTWKLK